MFAKIVISLSIFAVVAATYEHYKPHYKQDVAAEAPKYEIEHDHHADYYAYPKYKYKYGVEDGHTGDHKTHFEERDGDVVKGEYTVVDADGTVRTVKYTADKNGYNAVVYKNGEIDDPVAAAKKSTVQSKVAEVAAAPAQEYHHHYAPAGPVHVAPVAPAVKEQYHHKYAEYPY